MLHHLLTKGLIHPHLVTNIRMAMFEGRGLGTLCMSIWQQYILYFIISRRTEHHEDEQAEWVSGKVQLASELIKLWLQFGADPRLEFTFLIHGHSTDRGKKKAKSWVEEVATEGFLENATDEDRERVRRKMEKEEKEGYEVKGFCDIEIKSPSIQANITLKLKYFTSHSFEAYGNEAKRGYPSTLYKQLLENGYQSFSVRDWVSSWEDAWVLQKAEVLHLIDENIRKLETCDGEVGEVAEELMLGVEAKTNLAQVNDTSNSSTTTTLSMLQRGVSPMILCFIVGLLFTLFYQVGLFISQ